MAKVAAAASPTIALPALNIKTADVHLIGDSMLVTHAWDEKAKQMMRDTQQKKAKTAKTAKNPFLDFCGSLYWITPRPEDPTPAEVAKAKFGVPAIGLKAAAVDACSHIDGVTKVEARGAFHIDGEYVEIIGKPIMREDMVRVGMGTADLRYRASFWPWEVKFQLRYNANVLSEEQIVNLFNTAGFAIGLGEHRPQKDGSWGLFHVASAEGK